MEPINNFEEALKYIVTGNKIKIHLKPKWSCKKLEGIDLLGANNYFPRTGIITKAKYIEEDYFASRLSFLTREGADYISFRISDSPYGFVFFHEYTWFNTELSFEFSEENKIEHYKEIFSL